MKDNIPDELIHAFERHYDCGWNNPSMRNERLAWRAAWAAAMDSKPCLHQITEPTPAEQAAWHAGLDEGRAALAAAPAAEAEPVAKADPLDALRWGANVAETLLSIGRTIGFGRAQQILAEQWEIEHNCAPRGRMGVTVKDDAQSAPTTQPVAAPAPVVLPEPDAVLLNQGVELLHALSNDERNRGNCSSAEGATASAYAVQRLAALLATGGQAQAVKLLAADHSGMKVDYRGLFSQVQRALKRTDPGYAEMLRQLEGHLQELGQRWYAGDTDVVDEILQLYCIERDARKTVGVTATAAPQAQADARDAERLDWLAGQDNCVVNEGINGFCLCWIDEYDHTRTEYQKGSFPTAREAIDAALAAAKDGAA